MQNSKKSLRKFDAENFFSHAYDPGNSQHRVYVFDADYGKYFKGNFFFIRGKIRRCGRKMRPLHTTEVGRTKDENVKENVVRFAHLFWDLRYDICYGEWFFIFESSHRPLFVRGHFVFAHLFFISLKWTDLNFNIFLLKLHSLRSLITI